MRFFSKEIQEALREGKTIIVKGDKDGQYTLDSEGNIQCKYKDDKPFLSTNCIDEFTVRDWEILG